MLQKNVIANMNGMNGMHGINGIHLFTDDQVNFIDRRIQRALDPLIILANEHFRSVDRQFATVNHQFATVNHQFATVNIQLNDV